MNLDPINIDDIPEPDPNDPWIIDQRHKSELSLQYCKLAAQLVKVTNLDPSLWFCWNSQGLVATGTKEDMDHLSQNSDEWTIYGNVGNFQSPECEVLTPY